MNFISTYIFPKLSSFESIEEYQAYIDSENDDRRLLIKIASLAGFISCLIYGIFHIFPFFLSEAITALFLALFFFFSFISDRFIINPKILAITISVLVSGCFLYYFQQKGISGYDSYWFLIIPTLSISLLGIGIGFILSTSLFIIAVSILFIKHHSIELGIEEGLFFLYYNCFLLTTATYEWFRVSSRRKEIATLFKHKKEELAHKEKIELLNELSHQIRTPLNSIMGITNLMRQEVLSQDQQEYIDAINTSVMNLSLAMSSMLNLVNTNDENTNEQHILFFNISDTIKHIAKSYSLKHEKHNIKIGIDISSYIPQRLTGNAKIIEQILEGIFDSILLHSNRNDAEINVFVHNKKETTSAVDLLFEIHTSGIKHDNTDQTINTELGIKYDFSSLIDIMNLSKATQMIQALGGKLIHTKKENTIDVFSFSIVLWKSQVPDVHREESERTTLMNIPKNLSEASILIVEDNLMNQKVLSLTLEPMVKNIEIANNGKEALKLFESFKFDLILMDIQMPVLDGYKTTAKIRVSEIGTNFHVPIIALTANVMNGEMEKCLAYGMDDFIGKPFEMDMLIEKIKFYLEKRRNT